jgi:TseV toxin immunity protein TsiV
MVLGAAFYGRLGLRERPETALRVLAELRTGGPPGASVAFQGMLAGTDKFTRLTRMTDKTQDQIAIDLRAGVYSAVLGFRGSRDLPDASLSLDADPPPADPGVSQAAQYTMSCADPSEVERAELVSLRLWGLLTPTYGFSVLGASDTPVQEELSAVPIRPWNAPRDEHHEKRLARLQAARPSLGQFVRGAAWGTFLGQTLVANLGGLEAVRRAPVFRVQALESGGAYLRLTQGPALLGTSAYEAAASQLERFLKPVMPDVLKEPA